MALPLFGNDPNFEAEWARYVEEKYNDPAIAALYRGRDGQEKKLADIAMEKEAAKTSGIGVPVAGTPNSLTNQVFGTGLALMAGAGGLAGAGGGTAAGGTGGAAAGTGVGAAGAGAAATGTGAGYTVLTTPEALMAGEAATGELGALGTAAAGTTAGTAGTSLATLPAGGMTATGAVAPLAAANTGSSSVDPNTLSSLIQGGTALYAGQQGVNAAENATEEMRRQFDIGQENMAPWLEAGKTALTAQQELMGLGPNGPEAQLSALMNAPGYQFRLGQGQKALEASSAARGGMGSGKAGTAMAQYGQDYASNEYGNRLNQLAGLSGTGQSQAQYGAGLGMQYGGEMGNAALAGANARQSGILGAGSALSNWMNPQPQQLTLADYMRTR